MTKRLPLFLLAFLAYKEVCGQATLSSTCDVTAYYWRDFNEFIPPDAVLAGINSRNMSIYVGQTYHSNKGVIPGRIIDRNKKLVYDYKNEEYSTAEDVKILCTNYQDQLHWVIARKDAPLKDSFNIYKPIQGGYDGSTPLVIAKQLLSNGDLAMAQVPIHNDKLGEIVIASRTAPKDAMSAYMVLACKPFLTDEDKKACIKKDQCPKKTVNINIH